MGDNEEISLVRSKKRETFVLFLRKLMQKSGKYAETF